jgi:hypothetical protein
MGAWGFFPSGSSLRACSEADGEGIQRLSVQFLDCFDAMLLAMTKTLNFPMELPDLTAGNELESWLASA